MFKLVVTSPNISHELVFDSSRIVIGRQNAAGVDVGLEGSTILKEHIIIEQLEGNFYIINAANDPFATLNGDPFGKRKLQTNDILTLGNFTIRFEFLSAPHAPVSEDKLSQILDNAIQSKTTSAGPESHLEALEKELQELEEMSLDPLQTDFSHEEEPIEMDEIEALVREVEAMEWEEVQALSSYGEKATPAPSAPLARKPLSPYLPGHSQGRAAAPSLKNEPEAVEPVPSKTSQGPSLKHSKQKDDEDQEANNKSKPPTMASKIRLHWKWWVILISLALFLLFLLGGSFFFHMQEKRRIEEIKASQGVADIAMALMYARTNQIKPQNQNWSNPAFLKKNLGAVLSSKYQILATIDAQGQFSNSPYLLRIYPNHDLSQFLVIAQPAPSPLQSFFPRTTIVVDSREMELRKLKDLRELNRLLVNAKTFDTYDAEASSSIIKSGELIPLTSLTLSDNRLGFCPPRSLAVLRPGAENRIYNAPRYYLFGERILNQALSFENDESAQNAVRALQQDLKELEQLPNLVLYSTTGFTKALHAQKALATVAPDSQLLVGYLKLNPEGKVISSQLLMKHAIPPSTVRLWKTGENEIASGGPSENGPTAAPQPAKPSSVFYNELLNIAKSREQELSPIADKISALVLAQSKGPVEDFEEQLKTLMDEFVQTNRKEAIEKSQKIRQLLAQHSNVPMEELLKELDSAGLRPLLDKAAGKSSSRHEQAVRDEFKKKLSQIAQSSSLATLDAALNDVSALLVVDNVKDPKTLISYQKQLYEAVVTKLCDFLLSPNNHLPIQAFTSTNRILLDSIFQLAWIKDEEIKDYFLREFDILSSENKANSSN